MLGQLQKGTIQTNSMWADPRSLTGCDFCSTNKETCHYLRVRALLHSPIPSSPTNHTCFVATPLRTGHCNCPNASDDTLAHGLGTQCQPKSSRTGHLTLYPPRLLFGASRPRNLHALLLAIPAPMRPKHHPAVSQPDGAHMNRSTLFPNEDGYKTYHTASR